MGCGASSDKGRELNPKSEQTDGFFPPPNTTSSHRPVLVPPVESDKSNSIPSVRVEGNPKTVESSKSNFIIRNKNDARLSTESPLPLPLLDKKLSPTPKNAGKPKIDSTSPTAYCNNTAPSSTLVVSEPTRGISTSPSKKKKSGYVPPAPITGDSKSAPAASGIGDHHRPRSNSTNDNHGSGEDSLEFPAATALNGNTNQNSAPTLQKHQQHLHSSKTKNNHGTSSRNSNSKISNEKDDEEEEFHGELTLYNNLDLDNAISVVTTDPDLHSEIPVLTNSPNKKNSSKVKASPADLLGKMPQDGDGPAPYIYEYPEDSPEPSSESGMRFDELYRLKGVLGTGAFSTVREGFHRSNAEISYAVKCINRKKLTEEDEAALLDEVSILKELKHPHIIRLFDFFTEPTTYYLVMERMRGGELFDRIVAKAYYNEKEARDTCRIILRAVAYCHSHRVAHRDLKPENLLLLSDFDDSAVKIADFGFAKKVSEPNSLTTQCGTPGYVAPEILEGTKYDERADMWSVGVILYILLGGYPPFIESTQRDLFRKIRKGEYEFHEEYWGTVSQDAKTLISSLLTVSASERLTATGALKNAWIMGDDTKLASRDLGANLGKLRNFNAKRKFRAAVSTVLAVNKLNFLGKDFFTPKNTYVDFVPVDEDEE